MNKKTLIIGIILIVLIGLALVHFWPSENEEVEMPEIATTTDEDIVAPAPTFEERLRNATLEVPEQDGTTVALEDGEGVFPSGPVQGVVSMPTMYAEGLDEESNDVLTLLVVNSGGSGSFFYLVLLEDMGNAFVLQDYALLGDRVGVDDITTEPAGATYRAVVSMLVRAEGEPFAVEPTILEEQAFRVSDDRLIAE